MPLNVAGQNAAAAGVADMVTSVGIGVLADPGTAVQPNAVEASGGGYARAAVTWSAPANGLVSNSNALAFTLPAGSYASFLMFGADGAYYGFLPFVGSTALEGFAATDPVLANDALLSAGHGLSVGDVVTCSNVLGKILPGGLIEGPFYHVVDVSTDAFKVSTTSGGAPVDLTGLGQVYWQRVVADGYANGGTLSVAVGSLWINLGAL